MIKLTEQAAMDYLRDEAATVPADQHIVELGVYQGGSLAALAEGAAAGNGASVTGVDPYGLPGPGERYTRLTRRYGVENMAIAQKAAPTAMIARAFSTDLAKIWPAENRVGLLFIDAVHEYESVMADYLAWERHLAPQAVVAFDDCDDRFAGVRRAVTELFPQHTMVGARLAVVRFSERLLQ